jgi:hypothetical protein
MIEVLTPFYTTHYNFGIIGVLMVLLGLYLGSRKNFKGVLFMLGAFLVYNLVIYNKTKRDPEWYERGEEKVRSFDPVKKLWEERPADDDPNKRK